MVTPAPALTSSTLLAQLPTSSVQILALAQPSGSLLIGAAGQGGIAAGISINANGQPQILITGAGLAAAGTNAASNIEGSASTLPLFASTGPGTQLAELSLAVYLQPTQDGIVARLQKVESGSSQSSQFNTNFAELKELTEPKRTTPLEVTLVDGTKLTIDVGISGQALVLQLPPELVRQDALTLGVLAALAKSLTELGVSMADVKSIVLQQKLRQLAVR